MQDPSFVIDWPRESAITRLKVIRVLLRCPIPEGKLKSEEDQGFPRVTKLVSGREITQLKSRVFQIYAHKPEYSNLVIRKRGKTTLHTFNFAFSEERGKKVI